MGWNWIDGKAQLQPPCPKDAIERGSFISKCEPEAVPTAEQRELALRHFGDELEPFGGDQSGDCTLGDRSDEMSTPVGPAAGDIATPLYHSLQPNCSAHSKCVMNPGGIGSQAGNNCCNQDIIEQPVNLTTLNERYAVEALRFIAAHDRDTMDMTNSGRTGEGETPAPYFLYIAFAHMHVPHAFNSKWVNSSTRKTIFGDALREVDDAIGTIIDAVDRSSDMNNTLVFITADNGPWNCKCSLAGSQGPFLGTFAAKKGKATGKFTPWEGGHREMALAYWPARIAAGVSNVLGSTMDLMPTIASLAGASLPSSHVYDGLDLAPVFFEKASTHHQYLFHPGGDGALNAGRFGRYKVFWKASASKPCNTSNGDSFDWLSTDITGSDGNVLIFDLEADPAESTNITLSAGQVAHFVATRDSVVASIESTFRSTPDYSQATLKSDEPCCDVGHVVCRCTQENGLGTS